MMKNNSALSMTLPNLISTIDTVHQPFQTKALQSVSVNLTLRNAVKRNIERFPEKFRFQLTAQEFEIMEEEDTYLMFLQNKVFLCSQQY